MVLMLDETVLSMVFVSVMKKRTPKIARMSTNTEILVGISTLPEMANLDNFIKGVFTEVIMRGDKLVIK